MSIKRKTTSVAVKRATSKSTTPRMDAEDLGISEASALELHKLIEDTKQSVSELAGDATKVQILSEARRRIFSQRGGSFYLDIADGKSLLIKPNTRRYPISDEAIEAIEKIIEDAGYDADDYYHESQEIKMDADSIYDRLGEEEYETFQADLGEFMHKRKLGDCWSMKTSIIAKPDFFTSRHGLPVDVNMAIEEIKPMVIGVEAKRSI